MIFVYFARAIVCGSIKNTKLTTKKPISLNTMCVIASNKYINKYILNYNSSDYGQVEHNNVLKEANSHKMQSSRFNKLIDFLIICWSKIEFRFPMFDSSNP